MLLYQLGGRDHLSGPQRVADGVIGQSMVLAPGGGVAVQVRRQLGSFLPQAGAEQLGE
jgi:hypothetical protein